jgi:hypothetical protein
MKAAFLSVFILLSVFANAQQQPQPKSEQPKVPPKILQAFRESYPSAEVTAWRTEGDYYKVIFRDANVQQVILYDTAGRVFRKETQLDDKDVPATINQYYKNKYPEEQAFMVWKIEDENLARSYAATSPGVHIYFDRDGNYDRTEKKKHGWSLFRKK